MDVQNVVGLEVQQAERGEQIRRPPSRATKRFDRALNTVWNKLDTQQITLHEFLGEAQHFLEDLHRLFAANGDAQEPGDPQLQEAEVPEPAAQPVPAPVPNNVWRPF